MKIAKGVEALELEQVYPTLIWDDDTVVLIDTGFPGFLPLLREAFAKTGVPFERLGKVILTHQDVDHIGTLPDIRAALGEKVEIISHEVEKPYIQGDRAQIKTKPAELEKAVRSIPPDERGQFAEMVQNTPRAPVDKTVADGEELPFCGGITVVFTPGHTPGHICLYHRPSKTLVAGDALGIDGGRLSGPHPGMTEDMDKAVKSLEKLMGYDIDTVVCYHGGVLRGDINGQIAQIIK
jgi:glyoxylase-like metal-dependent hydrolase (beta-lactamase superfamily II)